MTRSQSKKLKLMPKPLNATAAGILLSVFPLELIDLTFALLTVPDLLILGATSNPNRLASQRELYRRVRMLVHPYFPLPDNLFTVMRFSRAVISGSLALRFMLPDQPWPRNFDIWVPVGRSRPLCDFLAFEGYVKSRPATHYWGGRVATSCIRTIQMFEKGDLKITVLEPNTPSVIDSITKAHLSSLMNYISADGFFSAYPILTAKKMAVWNPLSNTPHNDSIFRAVKRTFKKYAERGFSFSHLPLNHGLNEVSSNIQELFPHTCRRSAYCPHTMRSTYDRACLFVGIIDPLDKPYYAGDSTPVLYERNKGAVWNMGGEPCSGDEKYQTMKSFLVCNS